MAKVMLHWNWTKKLLDWEDLNKERFNKHVSDSNYDNIGLHDSLYAVNTNSDNLNHLEQ